MFEMEFHDYVIGTKAEESRFTLLSMLPPEVCLHHVTHSPLLRMALWRRKKTHVIVLFIRGGMRVT